MSSTMQDSLMWRCAACSERNFITMRIASRAVVPGRRRRMGRSPT